MANNFGSNTGEVLRAASQIKPGDFESWYEEFNFLAETLHAKASKINATRFPVSARELYFRSGSYYQAADFFLHGNWSDPRIYSLWNKRMADFDAATSLLPTPAFRKNISANSFEVPIIFFPAEHHGRKRGHKKVPTIVAGSGYDGSQEAMYHSIGRAVLDRGWNFVTYEGPGQPTPRRQQDLGFIPNWWDVVTPVVDWLKTQQDVDMDSLALVGFSFGGLLAPRAATREQRFKAVLAIDGIVNMQSAILNELPTQLRQLFKSGNETLFDEVMLGLAQNSSVPTQLRWAIDQSLFSFNTHSAHEWLTKLGEFTLSEEMLQNITSKVFVGEAQDDSTAPGQASQMADWLGDKATYNLWLSELGAGEHCSLGAESQLAQVTLDWLTDVFEGIDVSRNVTDTVE